MRIALGRRRRPSLVPVAAVVLYTAVARAVAPAPVTVIPAAQVAAAFEKGQPLLETSGYKVHASRREAPGLAEVHVRDTDVIHVLGGRATLVTGGTAVEPKTVAPDEIRGTRIEGGDARTLAPGDVVVVPNGVPHQFLEVEAPFTYFVVKVTAATGAPK